MEYGINNLIKRYPILKSCKSDILKACDILITCFKNGHKLLICGNGGSCSDANHICGELMKGFIKKRPISSKLKNKICKLDKNNGLNLSNALQEGFPCIALDNHQSLNTAFINDIKDGGLYSFAQQVNVFGQKGDVLLAISTSGNSKNVYNASIVAKSKNIIVICLTGLDGGILSKISNISIKVKETETYKIQELHLPIYHFICYYIENYFFNI